MTDVFEVDRWDGAGRLGRLAVPRADVTVTTPALLPVVNPNVETVAPGRLEREFGVEMLITNGYIVHTTEGLRERALEVGLHELLGFSGAIMTDSGSFQLATYDDVDVSTDEILRFQREIGSDVGTPVDVPTPPDADRDRACEELRATERALADAEAIDRGEMLVSAPVQGSTHLDLRERAGRHAADTALDVFPVGAVVPLLNAYRFADVVEVVRAAKRGLGPAAPVHLFGAGHPMTLALAAAAGCDLFDSAAYALYARDGRYLTVRGTRHLDELAELPCPCPVCTGHDPAGLRERAPEERERLLAEHNLHASLAEIRRIRAAIRAGDLFELVETRARGHPALWDGYRALLDHADGLERTDPASKGTFFAVSTDGARRPEIDRHHDRLARVAPADDRRLLLTVGDAGSAAGFDEVWRVVPPFGPVAPALSKSYPLTAETPARPDRAAREAAARGVARLAAACEAELVLAHDGWPASALSRLPERVTVERLGGARDGARDP